VTAVCDLLPITLPPGNFVEGGTEWFEGWLRKAIAASDGLVCISKTTADTLIDYVERHNLGRKGLRIGYWHLGSNLPVADATPIRSPLPARDFGSYCLMVGTIEPRKSHALALDAFERLWSRDLELNLVVAGKPGWMVDGLMERIKAHHLLNKRLFLFERPTDAEVAHLYRNAEALLLLSKGEGFGLPLVEAAHYGVSVLCSDIPVFREIAGEHATYLGIADPEKLAEEIAEWRRRHRAGASPISSDMPRLSWEESTEALIDVVWGGAWYWNKP
jgi:glycosyltransferase involved in cell wall biosynthesis